MSDSCEPGTAQKITLGGETPAFVLDHASGHGLDDVPRLVCSSDARAWREPLETLAYVRERKR